MKQTNSNACSFAKRVKQYSVYLGVLTAGLLCSGTAWANAGFFGNGAANLKMTYKVPKQEQTDLWFGGETGFNNENVEPVDLGMVESLTLSDVWARTWRDNSGNVCGVNLYYKDGESAQKSHWFNKYTHYSPCEAADCATWQPDSGAGQTMNISLVNASTVPGNHNCSFWFSGTGNTSASSGCNNDAFWLTNGGSNYSLLYQAPGFKSSTESTTTLTEITLDMGITTIAEHDHSKWGDVDFVHYGIHLGDSCAFWFEGKYAEYFVVRDSTERNQQDGSTRISAEIMAQIPAGFVGIMSSDLIVKDAHGRQLTIKCMVTVAHAPSLFVAQPADVTGLSTANLYGYLKYTGCMEVVEWGFAYNKREKKDTPIVPYTDKCDPSSVETARMGIIAQEVVPVGSGSLKEGDVWKGTLEGLSIDSRYDYVPYIIYRYTNDFGDWCYDPRIAQNEEKETVVFYETFDTPASKCKYPEGDTIYYTIDVSWLDEEEDPCLLRFNKISKALADLKLKNGTEGEPAWVTNNGESCMLLKPVVFQIKPGTYKYDLDDLFDTNPVKIEGVNCDGLNNGEAICTSVPKYPLILRSYVPGVKPEIRGLSLGSSRYVIVDGISINRMLPEQWSSYAGASLILGVNKEMGNEWNTMTVGKYSNSMITIKNSRIQGNCFCVIHAAGLDGLTIMNTEMDAEIEGNSANDIEWGSSIKLCSCKNVRLLSNSLKGSHATSVFAQHVQNMLIMNNVFWNNNKYTQNVTFIRPVYFGSGDTGDGHDLKNWGIFYNTFYLAETDKGNYKVEFIHFNADKVDGAGWIGKCDDNNKSHFHPNLMSFAYNNCYSWDQSHVTGQRVRETSTSDYQQNAFGVFDVDNDVCPTFTPNNYWSRYDEAQSPKPAASAFTLGCSEDKYVNVGNLMCQQGANDPDGLVIKGTDLDLGNQITAQQDFSGLGAETITADRFHANIRPTEGNWSLGAYQKSDSKLYEGTLYWCGGTDNDNNPTDWDTRGNWLKEDGTTLTCLDNLPTNLKVVIPAPNTTVYPNKGEITNYPIIPDYNASGRSSNGERVETGMGTAQELPGTFFVDMDIEYGGAVRGVENLAATDRRYHSATTHLNAGRSHWILVGTVVKPFVDESVPTSRLVKSGDFYIANQEPHVYMHKIGKVTNDGGKLTVDWNATFGSLTQEVPVTDCYAIQIPNQYGPKKYPDYKYYAGKPEKMNDGSKEKYYTFTGEFAAEATTPEYAIDAGEAKVLNNYYPADLDVDLFVGKHELVVYPFDYSSQTFNVAVPGTGASVKPMAGFCVVNNGTSAVTIKTTDDMYTSASTAYKKAEQSNPVIYVAVKNTKDATGSHVAIYENIFKTTSVDMTDGQRVFSNSSTSAPEIYVALEEGRYALYHVAKAEAVVPLGVRNISGKVMKAQFYLRYIDQYAQAILEDRQENKTYNLLKETPEIEIPTGYVEGRFFLNLKSASEDILPAPGDGGSGVITDKVDAESEVENIDIFANGNVITVSSTSGLPLQTVTVSDMGARTQVYKVNGGHYFQLPLKVVAGVYVVQVVADGMTKEQKVLIK